MGTNPKRTVTVQMVPQLAEVDTLGNKEANANWAKDPNLNLTQDHSTPTFTHTSTPTSTLTSTPTSTPTSIPTSTEHTQDNASLITSTPTSRIPTAGQGEPLGGGGVSSVNTPLPANGDRGKSELVTGGEKQQMPCRGVGEPGAVRGDDNANMSALTNAAKEEKDICKASLASAVASSKVDTKTNDCRDMGLGSTGECCAEPTATAKSAGASTAKESLVKDSSKGIAFPNNQKPNHPSDLEHAASEVCKHDKGAEGTSTTTKDPAPPLPLKSKKLDNNNSARLSSSPANTTTSESELSSQVSKAAAPGMEYNAAELLQWEKSKETAAAPAIPTAVPPSESRKPDAGLTHEESSDKPSSPTHPKTDLKPPENTQLCLDRHQPQASQKDSSSSTSPQAQRSQLAQVHIQAQVVDEAIQTAPGLEKQKPHCKLYREASTMTSTMTPTATPTRSKQCQDVEVQAVANVCSRAVSTSPSLLPLAPPHRPSRATQREEAESLAVVCQGDGVGVRPLVPSQIHTGTCPPPAPANNADLGPESLTLEAGLCSSQSTGVDLHTEATVALQQARLGAKPKEPGTALCNTQKGISPLQPVYQINIEPCGQNEQVANASHHRGQPADPQCKPCAAEEKKPTVSETPAQPTQHAKPPAARASSSQLESPPSASTESESKSKSDINKAAAAPPQPAASSSTQPSKDQATSRRTEDSKPKSLLSGLLTGITKDFSKKDPGKSASKKQKLGPNRKQGDDEDEGKPRVKSVHDVLWDEQGMTWEVYGASVDPESLGFAIQSHLQCKIKEQEKKIVAQTSIRKSISAPADSPPGKGRKNKRRQQNVIRSLLQNVRRPNCCARPPPSSVLE